AGVPGSAKDEPDFARTFDTPHVLPLSPRQAARDTSPRIRAFRLMSFVLVEFLFSHWRESGRVFPITRVDVIEQRSQRRSRRRIADDLLPARVTIEFGHEARERFCESGAIFGCELFDRGFDLLDSRH